MLVLCWFCFGGEGVQLGTRAERGLADGGFGVKRRVVEASRLVNWQTRRVEGGNGEKDRGQRRRWVW